MTDVLVPVLLDDTGQGGSGSTLAYAPANIDIGRSLSVNVLPPRYYRRRLDNSRGNDRKAMTSPPTVGASTTVSGANGLNSATINVASTANFPSSGTLTIAGLPVTYTGITGTSFTGCGNHAAYTGGEAVSITFGTTSGITGGISWPAISQANSGAINQLGDRFTYTCGGSPQILGNVFPDYQYIKFTHVTSPIGGTSPYVASFYFDGTTLELSFKGVAGFIMLKVDDEYVSLTPTTVTTTGSTYFMPITFASRLTRRIDVIASVPFGGVQTGPSDSVVPTEVRGPRCIVLGDSFTEGTGADGGATTNWTRQFADMMGWDDVWASGLGGTGYLNPSTGGKVKFRDRTAHDVVQYAPDVVVVAGGFNDIAYNPGTGIVSAAAIGAEALALFRQIVAGMATNALLVVVSPFWRNGPSTMTAALIAARDAIKSACLAVGGTFIDILEMSIPNGTPVTTTLSANTGAGSGTVNLPVVIPVRGVLQIGNDRAEVKSIAGGGPYTHTLDGTLVSAHTAGETVTQVGGSLWTGTGHVGATTGYGNSDLLVSSDGTHPTQAGHTDIGTVIARLVARSGAL